ncbi:hypothetical protein KVT40_009225 [Elsinoe batatas]|uniref:Uncharacterized protein n=1 Tax=Elsinoe batatas TaxID=2601811 RepID=A0A8K0KUK3_9PEZI|nr:hypothetical protein KVT40_009225 [Elsinoe batatas]
MPVRLLKTDLLSCDLSTAAISTRIPSNERKSVVFLELAPASKTDYTFFVTHHAQHHQSSKQLLDFFILLRPGKSDQFQLINRTRRGFTVLRQSDINKVNSQKCDRLAIVTHSLVAAVASIEAAASDNNIRWDGLTKSLAEFKLLVDSDGIAAGHRPTDKNFLVFSTNKDNALSQDWPSADKEPPDSAIEAGVHLLNMISKAIVVVVFAEEVLKRQEHGGDAHRDLVEAIRESKSAIANMKGTVHQETGSGIIYGMKAMISRAESRGFQGDHRDAKTLSPVATNGLSRRNNS